MNNEVLEKKSEVKSFEPKIGIRRKGIWGLVEKLGYLKGNEFLGLDIGHSSVKIVQLEKEKGSWKLVRAEMEETSPLSKREITKDPTLFIITAIKKIIEKQKIKVKNVVSGISGEFVVERVIKLPKMKKNELKEALFWEAKKEVNWPPEKIVIDYSVNENEKDSNEFDVFLVIAQREMIEKHLSLLKGAGLIPFAVESKAGALNACLKEAKVLDYKTTQALLDIGAQSCFLVISEDGFLRFSREIKIGGDDLTYAISDQLNCDIDSAEGIKKQKTEDLKNREDGDLILNAILQQLDRVAIEVNRSFDYFKAQNPQKKIKTLFLTGGGSKLYGLEKFFENQLKIKTKRINPFEKILLEDDLGYQEFLEDFAPHLTLALGLATWRKK